MDDRRAPMTISPWEKLGLLVGPDLSVPWRQSHAQLPVVTSAPGEGADRFHAYFASRDGDGRSHIGRALIELGETPRLVAVEPDPVLSPGALGAFDCDGVYPASLVTIGGRQHLYYVGWLRGARQPLFYAAIGLVTAPAGSMTFTRHSVAPLVDRGPFDPCLVTSPGVYADGAGWRMVYVSGLSWEERDGALHSRYHLKAATSPDGVVWTRNGAVAVDFKDAGEANLARPCVVKTRSGWQMWFCAASPPAKYRLAYAESSDGVTWRRCDEMAGLAPSAAAGAFDSEMTAYPFVVRHGGADFLFYNGNSFGRDGFAVARRPSTDV
jgi:hypothetical protein